MGSGLGIRLWRGGLGVGGGEWGLGGGGVVVGLCVGVGQLLCGGVGVLVVVGGVGGWGGGVVLYRKTH